MLRTLKTIPPGPLVILLIAVLSSATIAFWPSEEREGLVFWTFAQHHARMYHPAIQDWNERAATSDAEPIQMFVLSMGALNRRTQSGMWAQTATSDLVEIEQPSVARFMAGPVEEVGFYDLTDLLRDEGIYNQLNEPSFAPWTSRGRIFGLPHDVHPVLLCYRADLVEEAGIDVSKIKTWDDFEEAMRPLVNNTDGDGETDRYALGLWYTSARDVEALLLQAGGGTFNAQGESIIASDANTHVIARMVRWCVGPNRIAIDAPEFSPSGNELKLRGSVVAALMPDWLAGVWMNDLSALKGKLKLMPLPAWEEGGRRTSVMGGTMIAIPKTTRDFDSAWAFAKELYLSPVLAQKLFESNHIISPKVGLWGEPYYAVKEPYFSDQQSGMMYIDQAPNVPFRTSSPFHQVAMQQIMDAASALKAYAEANDAYEIETLMPEAKRLLESAEQRIEQEMSRNVFIAGDTMGGADDE
ncbi:MAG: extracellular solute-binding protein [Phycisphaeraceae bacterium]|nr:extracellular solute-binding protein [Phycisphaeraceae bacterium]